MRNAIAAWIFVTLLCFSLATCGGQPTPSLSPIVLPTPQPVPSDALVLTNGTVIAGIGAPPIPDGIVVIQRERVIAVGRAADYAIPAGIKVVDAKRGTILPGIFNAHVHGVASKWIRRNDFLLQGVTSVCDLGSALQEMPDFKQDFSSHGPAARGFRAGPIITVPGGYPGVLWGSRLNYEVKNPDEARAAVTDLASRGADVIKIALEPGSAQNSWPTLDMAEVKAIVEEAHTHGLFVRAHLQKTALLDLESVQK